MSQYSPKLRIVTPSFNQGAFIAETIDSVLSLGYPNLEYVVIDGGSADESVEVIRKYQKYLLFWRSESDDGQVDAILKGLSGFRGEFFTWINSDDIAVPELFDYLATYTGTCALSGSVENFFEDGSCETKINRKLDIDSYLERFSPTVFHQPGVIWPNSDILIKSLRPEFHYIFDQILLFQHLLHLGPIHETKLPAARFRMHRASKTMSQSAQFAEEFIRFFTEISEDQSVLLSHRHRKNLELKSWDISCAMYLKGTKKISLSAIIWKALRSGKLSDRVTVGLIRRYIGDILGNGAKVY